VRQEELLRLHGRPARAVVSLEELRPGPRIVMIEQGPAGGILRSAKNPHDRDILTLHRETRTAATGPGPWTLLH
jgi:hypothetical protein